VIGGTGFCAKLSDVFHLNSWPCLLLVSSKTGNEKGRICGRVSRSKIDMFLKKPEMLTIRIILPDGKAREKQFVKHFLVQVLFDACQELVGRGPISIRYYDVTGTSCFLTETQTGKKIQDYIHDGAKVWVHRVKNKTN